MMVDVVREARWSQMKILLIFPLSHDYVTDGYVITFCKINKYTTLSSVAVAVAVQRYFRTCSYHSKMNQTQKHYSV